MQTYKIPLPSKFPAATESRKARGIFIIMGNEIWKDVEGYEGLYQVSNLGRVRSLDRVTYNPVQPGCVRHGKLIKPQKRGRYLFNALRKDGEAKQISIHRLVASAFVPNPNNYPVVNHKNENKYDNRAENLEWCTQKYNCNYGQRNRKTGDKHFKPVMSIDKFGNTEKFESILAASKSIGLCRSTIGNAVTGRNKTAGGKKWVFI